MIESKSESESKLYRSYVSECFSRRSSMRSNQSRSVNTILMTYIHNHCEDLC